MEGNVRVALFYDGSRDRSRAARERVEETIDSYRGRFLEDRAENMGVSRAAYQQF
ncbi:MAG: hypothetical protein FJY97_17445 [candidate division Zixibacteria bacterium]|nr:hypothetical protein [candidate division Zixibacteria bacterium]